MGHKKESKFIIHIYFKKSIPSFLSTKTYKKKKKMRALNIESKQLFLQTILIRDRQLKTAVRRQS